MVVVLVVKRSTFLVVEVAVLPEAAVAVLEVVVATMAVILNRATSVALMIISRGIALTRRTRVVIVVAWAIWSWCVSKSGTGSHEVSDKSEVGHPEDMHLVVRVDVRKSASVTNCLARWTSVN